MIFACIAGAGMAWFYRRLSPCGGCMEFPSEGRTVGFGLLAAVSAFGGVLAAGYGSVLFLGSWGASPPLRYTLSSRWWLDSSEEPNTPSSLRQAPCLEVC